MSRAVGSLLDVLLPQSGALKICLETAAICQTYHVV
jgi:hypothetical protein